MGCILSLIACPSKSPLTSQDVEQAGEVLGAAGAKVAPVVWLSPHEACEIPFVAAEVAIATVRAAFAGRPIDVNVVPGDVRRKRLLLADMDSTLIEQECIDELAAEVGVKAEVAAITERAMRGEIAFEPALRERVALLKGLSTDVVGRLLAGRITIMPGAASLVATMRRAGAYTALVSGGFTVFAGAIGERIGFHERRANELMTEADAFTGMVAEPILGQDAKEAALRELTASLGLQAAETMAVGDGANDSAMIRLAGLGVAYRAKPALRAAADAVIDNGDLTALLFLQGYRRDEFAAP